MKGTPLLCLFLTFLSCGEITMMKKPLVIGHRGAMGHATENSLPSVQRAMELGVDMIEIDVFRIRSGEIVVFHDERVDRLTNGGGAIEDYNIFDLRQLLLDGNYKIPMLQDVLKLINNKVRLNIELKGADTADRVNFIIDYYVTKKGWSLDNFLISSFKWDELRKIRKLNPDIGIAILTDDDPLKALPVANELKAESVNPNYQRLTEAVVSEIHRQGFKIYTWTVNEPDEIREMKDFGVDGIITNYPELVH